MPSMMKKLVIAGVLSLLGSAVHAGELERGDKALEERLQQMEQLINQLQQQMKQQEQTIEEQSALINSLQKTNEVASKEADAEYRKELENLREEFKEILKTSQGEPGWWTKTDLHAEIRTRFELQDNFDFSNETSNDADFIFLRTRLGLGLNPVDTVRLYVQLQDSRNFGQELTTTADTHNVDLHQGYVDLTNLLNRPLSVRVGRQELSYGDERVIGNLEWTNVGRAFDGVKVRYQNSKFWVDAFATEVTERDVPGIGTDDDANFYGIYSWLDYIPRHPAEVYFLYLKDSQSRFFGENRYRSLFQEVSPNDQEVGTFGTRIVAKPWHGIDYNTELAYQIGEVGNDDVQAYAVHLGTGYTLPIPWKPRLGLQYNIGSGDPDPLDRKFNTFSNLFPTNHKHYGIMDFASWQNLRELVFELTGTPLQKVKFKLDYHVMNLDHRSDAFYNVAGVPRTGGLGRPIDLLIFERDSDDIGEELDFILTYLYSQYVNFQIGYGHFWPGRVIDEGVVDEEDANFAYAQMTVSF